MGENNMAHRALMAIYYILLLVIVSGMMAMGMLKLVGLQSMRDKLDSWSIPLIAQYGIGLVEIILAILIFVPTTRRIGLVLLSVEMIIATAFHLFHKEANQVYGAGFVLGMALVSIVLYTKVNQDVNTK